MRSLQTFPGRVCDLARKITTLRHVSAEPVDSARESAHILRHSDAVLCPYFLTSAASQSAIPVRFSVNAFVISHRSTARSVALAQRAHPGFRSVFPPAQSFE